MAEYTYRTEIGRPLTHAEVDDNLRRSEEIMTGTTEDLEDSIEARDKAQEWAESEGEPEPGSQSARTWALAAGTSAQSASDDADRAEAAVGSLPEGTINDNQVSLSSVYSSKKIEDDFLSKEDAGTGSTRDVGPLCYTGQDTSLLVKPQDYGLGWSIYYGRIPGAENDANEFYSTGWYHSTNGMRNIPAGIQVNASPIFVIPHGIGNIHAGQLLIDRNTTFNMYGRMKNNSIWGDWVRFVHTGNIRTVIDSAVTYPAASATTILDLAEQQVFHINVSNNRTISFSNAPGSNRAMTVVINLYNPSLSSRAITWPAGIIWPAGEAPSFNGTEAVVILVWTGRVWMGSVGVDNA